MGAFSWNDADLSNLNDDIYPEFMLAADTPYDCPSLSPPLTRMYARANSCANSDTSPDAEVQPRPEITTADQVQEYWCSAGKQEGFGNIPVCDRSQRAIVPLVRPSELELKADVIPPPSSPASDFKNLGWCSLSKFIYKVFVNTSVRMVGILCVVMVPLSVNPWNAFDCPEDQVWCCNAWLHKTGNIGRPIR